jgi:tetratricopeptide (TPR) repeat protein
MFKVQCCTRLDDIEFTQHASKFIRSKPVANLTRSLQLEADIASNLRSRGFALLGLGRYDAALEDLDRSLQLDPDNELALRVRGEVLKALAASQRDNGSSDSVAMNTRRRTHERRMGVSGNTRSRKAAKTG